jgi:hypothetical protein
LSGNCNGCPLVALEVAVKNDVPTIPWRVPWQMPAMSVMTRIARRTLGKVTMTVSLCPARTVSIASDVAMAFDVIAPFAEMIPVPLALMSLFGMGPVVPIGFSGVGQGGGAATNQCGSQNEQKQFGLHGVSPFA